MSKMLNVSTSSWIDVASDNSTINIKELKEWLGIASTSGLKSLAASDPNFPVPRIGKFMSGGKGGTPARWRVGDIRAWLKGVPSTPFQISANRGRTAKERKDLGQLRGEVVLVSRHRA